MSTSSHKATRDFEHTVRVVTARLHAAEAHLANRPAAQVFTISLKAAASVDGLLLPRGEILASGSQLAVTISAGASDLRISLQLKGFSTLQQFKGKAGRLLSDDKRVDIPFRFDDRGSAVCVMTDSDIARAGLAHFHVEVFDEA